MLSGNTLTIPAGTILKFQNTGALSTAGKTLVNGTADSKVIFTSIKDDAYGGDTNADGSVSVPQAGDWLNLTFASGSSSSTIDNALVRYGKNGAIKVDGVSIDIKNTTVENNYSYGVWLNNSTSTIISSSLIQDHQKPEPGSSYGLFLTASSTPFIQNTNFKNNKTGIFADGTSSVQNGGGIIFDGNTINTTPANLIP